MQIYADMFFSGAAPALQSLLLKLDSEAKFGGWTRDFEAEGSVGTLLTKDEIVRGYRGKPIAEAPEVDLWLHITPREWSVTNVVPRESDRLSATNYTLMLSSFRSAVLRYADDVGVKITEPVADVGIDHFLSPEAAKELRKFSVLANKAAGPSHPRDLSRWNKFVIAAHRDSCKLGAGELARLLVEHEDWPEEKALELSLLFEYEISLLHSLDEAC